MNTLVSNDLNPITAENTHIYSNKLFGKFIKMIDFKLDDPSANSAFQNIVLPITLGNVYSDDISEQLDEYINIK
jgi:hypothetical protein